MGKYYKLRMTFRRNRATTLGSGYIIALVYLHNE